MKRMLVAVSVAMTGLLVCGGDLVSEKPVFALEAGSAAEWKNPRPDLVGVETVKGAGRNGRDILRFRVLGQINSRLTLTGPAFRIPACSPETVRRRLMVRMTARRLGWSDGAVGVNLVHPGGARFSGVAGNRDFDTAVYFAPRPRHGNWQDFRGGDYGCKARTNGEIVGNVTVDFTVRDAKGTFDIESFEIVDTCSVSHVFKSAATGHIFMDESGTVDVRWAKPGEIAKASVRVTDEEGRVRFSVARADGETTTSLRLPTRGYYGFSATATYGDGVELTTESSAAVVGPVLDERVRRASRFGLVRCHMSVPLAIALGSNLDSGMFWDLGVVENADGTLRSTYDPKAKVTPRSFIQLDGLNGGLPRFVRNPATTSDCVYPPTDWKKFGDAVELWAKTRPDLPDFVSPYQEVDGAWRGTDAELVRFHNVFVDAVKRGKPTAKTSAPVFCSNDVDHFMRLVKQGLMRNVDAVNLHPYVNGTPPEGKFIRDIIRLQKEMRENGIGELPIYFTEFGWSCWSGDWQKPVDSITRARYCARSLILCTARDIAGLVYFSGKCVSSEDREHYFLVHSDDTPWPALAAYAGVTRQLSTVKGGVYVPLSPNLYLCAFKRDGRALWTVWTMNGNGRLPLPSLPTSVLTMTGEPEKAEGEIVLSPSPRYVEFSDAGLAEIAQETRADVVPGDSISVAGEPVIVPEALTRSAGGFRINEDAEPGDYALLVRRESGLTAVSFRVIAPCEISFSRYSFGKEPGDLTLDFSALFNWKQQIRGSVAVTFDGAKVAERAFEAAGGGRQTVSVPVQGVRTGRRIKAEAVFALTSPIRRIVRVPFGMTPTPIAYFPTTTARQPWEKIDEMDITSWQRVPDEIKASQIGPAKAWLKLYANQEGFALRVRVSDREHVQRHGSWSGMYEEDSIQFAFDLDADKPYKVNVMGEHFAGHRVSELGESLTVKGQCQMWLYKAFFPGGSSGAYFPEKGDARVTRDDARQETVYEAFIPWDRIGAEVAPEAGTALGFTLLINDKNSDANRRFLIHFGGGIPNPEKMLSLALLSRPPHTTEGARPLRKRPAAAKASSAAASEKPGVWKIWNVRGDNGKGVDRSAPHNWNLLTGTNPMKDAGAEWMVFTQDGLDAPLNADRKAMVNARAFGYFYAWGEDAKCQGSYYFNDPKANVPQLKAKPRGGKDGAGIGPAAGISFRPPAAGRYAVAVSAAGLVQAKENGCAQVQLYLCGTGGRTRMLAESFLNEPGGWGACKGKALNFDSEVSFAADDTLVLRVRGKNGGAASCGWSTLRIDKFEVSRK